MNTSKMNLFIKKVLGNTAKKALIKCLYPFRNSFILFNVSNTAKKNEVNLNYWDEAPNLGDYLSYVVVKYMLDQKGIDIHKRASSTRHLYGIGSILTQGIQDCTVWGSGILTADLLYRLNGRKFDIRAVRGPLTRTLLLDHRYEVPAVYGDPAIIMKDIYTPCNITKTYKYGVVIHKDQKLSDKDFDFISSKDVLEIDIRTRDYKGFIDALCSCNIIISSSLHGIILAETYGVPAIMYMPNVDYNFKFFDYYYSTGRMDFPIVRSYEEALTTQPIETPNLDALRKNLKNAFPYDLYI